MRHFICQEKTPMVCLVSSEPVDTSRGRFPYGAEHQPRQAKSQREDFRTPFPIVDESRSDEKGRHRNEEFGAFLYHRWFRASGILNNLLTCCGFRNEYDLADFPRSGYPGFLSGLHCKQKSAKRLNKPKISWPQHPNTKSKVGELEVGGRPVESERGRGQQRGDPAYSQPWTTRRRLNSAGPQFEFHHHDSKVGTSQ
ncbi:hypothetical protein Landi51_01881 [Colletotrichum acutatum]